MTGLVPISTVLPEVQAAMARAAKRWEDYCESLKPEFEKAPPTKPCTVHPEQQRKKLFEASCRQSRADGYFRAVYEDCEVCLREEITASNRRFWAKRGIPERVLLASFSNFEADTPEKERARDAVKAWSKGGGNFLLLVGTQGTGKGHLAASALRYRGNGLFITHADMIVDLRNSYTMGNTKDLIEHWQDAEMLVLDEFGVRSEGKDEAPMLYQVLADRYDKRRPTIITSNLPLSELREILGYRLLDRIQEDCSTVICRWESYRTGKPPTTP